MIVPRDQAAVLCGELQSVIGCLRREGQTFVRLEESAAVDPDGATNFIPSRGLFCVSEPGMFVDVLQINSVANLRADAQKLMTAARAARERLRAFMGNVSTESPLNPIDVLEICLEIVKSPAMSSKATGAALAATYRMITDLGMVNHNVVLAEKVVDATADCVFRLTESGADEIAIMWALEVLEGCTKHAQGLPEKCVERVFVTLFKNSVAASNADMLRRLAIRKLTFIVQAMFKSNFSDRTNDDRQLVHHAFRFLIKRVEMRASNWHDMESRQTCVELILAALVTSTSPESGRIMIEDDEVMHELVRDNLFLALIQICQAAGKPVSDTTTYSPEVEGSDMLKVVSVANLKKAEATAPQPQESSNGGQAYASSDSSAAASSSPSSRSELGIKGLLTNFPKALVELERQYEAAADVRAAEAMRRLEAQTLDSNGNQVAVTVAPKLHPRMPTSVLTGALRIVHLLLSHQNTRKSLGVQLEAFFNAVFLRALEPKAKGTDSEARRLVVETLTDLLADPSVPVDLYCNFDCSLSSTNVYENLFVYLSNLSFRKQVRRLALDTLQLMALRCLHMGVKAIANRNSGRVGQHTTPCPTGAIKPEELDQLKTGKQQLALCAEKFNEKFEAGIAALVAAKMVDDPPTPQQVATFLRNTKALDKGAIGQLLGDSGEFSESVLSAFVDTFDMDGMPLLTALRMFLESFRLPGEAQMIDRVLQRFAEVAHDRCVDAKTFPTVDCTYLLSFSIILLNTDLHNPNIRPEKKMSYDAFELNNKNYGAEVSKGQDMPLDLLRRIYDEIKTREINKMSEGTRLTAEITPEGWRDLMRLRPPMRLVLSGLPATATELDARAYLRLYDRQMFAAMHKQALTAFSVVYHAGDPASQPNAVDIALAGIMCCANIAASFGMIQVIDRVAIDLSKFTSLLKYAQAHPVSIEDSEESEYEYDTDGANGASSDENENEDEDEDENENEHVEVESASSGHIRPNGGVEVRRTNSRKTSAGSPTSSLTSSKRSLSASSTTVDVLGSMDSIKSAIDYLQRTPKAQTATTSVFDIACLHGNSIRQAWPHLHYCLLRLFDLDQLPTSLLLESSDGDFIEPEMRLMYHKSVAKVWTNEIRNQIARARDQLERAKGWVSWLSGESRADAEHALALREMEEERVLRAVDFASFSLSSINSKDASLPSPQTPIGHIDLGRLGTFIQDTTSLDDLTLVAFVRGIVLACHGDASACPSEAEIVRGSREMSDSGKPTDDTADDVRPDITLDMLTPSSQAARLFGLNLLIEVALKNISRIRLIWGMVRTHLLRSLRPAKVATCHTEKASVGLLRIGLMIIQSNEDSEAADDAASTIRVLSRLSSELCPGFSTLLAGAVTRILRKPNLQWSSALSRTVRLVVQSDDEETAVAVLFALCEPEILARVTGKDLSEIFCANLEHVLRHRSEALLHGGANIGDDKDGEEMIQVLDLIANTILNSKQPETDETLLSLLVRIGLGESFQVVPPPRVRLHAARLATTRKSVVGNEELNAGLEKLMAAFPQLASENAGDATASGQPKPIVEAPPAAVIENVAVQVDEKGTTAPSTIIEAGVSPALGESEVQGQVQERPVPQPLSPKKQD